jgi:hypothetical protein
VCVRIFVQQTLIGDNRLCESTLDAQLEGGVSEYPGIVRADRRRVSDELGRPIEFVLIADTEIH